MIPLKIREVIHVEPLEQAIRLSDYLPGKLQSYPLKKGIKKAIKKKLILVNKASKSTGWFLKGGEIIEVLEDRSQINKPVYPLNFSVIFEDDHLAIIDKPPGVLVAGNSFFTIENATRFNLKISSEIDALLRPSPAHRLDFPTVGLLIIAKTQSALIELKSAFENQTILKTYHAICIGTIPSEGKVELPIDEKKAITQFKVLESFPSPRFGQLNWIELKPKTGRKHQLRRHLAQIGHPILGDPQYCPKDLILKKKGLYLQAQKLGLNHPFSGEWLELELPLPLKFEKVINNKLRTIQ